VRWAGAACLLVAIVGFVMFLYGANRYNGTVGWTGLYLLVAGLFVYVVLRVLWPESQSAAGQKP